MPGDKTGLKQNLSWPKNSKKEHPKMPYLSQKL
jgi:hypothetical protein